jgi:hypothetical protein
MAPYIDSMDGPVVKAAEKALDMEDIKYVLPYVSPEDEEEIKNSFDKSLMVRELSADAAELADYWFFETTVRLHRKEENKTYTGLKSAGTDWGPIIPKIDLAIETENIDELLNFILNFIREDIKSRFDDLLYKKDYDPDDVEDARDYILTREYFIEYTRKFYEYVEKG